MSSMTLFLSST